MAAGREPRYLVAVPVILPAGIYRRTQRMRVGDVAKPGMINGASTAIRNRGRNSPRGSVTRNALRFWRAPVGSPLIAP
jgi:hypothetical protein